MADDLTFLRALLASPEDNALRLVYADWLEERGDARGAYLRLEAAAHVAEPTAQPHDHRERLHRARHALDPRWLALVDRPQAGWRLVRPGPPKAYGKAIPAFIHNGGYYLSAIEVYADGAINCWGFVDLPLFRDKLATGWVATRAEIGDTISIHNLGQARVAAAEWDLSPDDMDRQVSDTLRELSPTMQGLLDMQGTDTELRDGVRHAKGPSVFGTRPYRVTLTGDEVAGAELPVLELVAGGYRLRPWLIYADGLTQLGCANELVPPEEVAQMFGDGRLTLSVPAGAWVTLDGLGRFQAGEGNWWIDPGERLREASDLLDQLNGGPGAIHHCFVAHAAYKSGPSRERREALREAYEAVPKHLRRFCGDMDSKDGPIRRILFGPRGEDEPG